MVRLRKDPLDKVVIGGRFVCDPGVVGWLHAALPLVVVVRGGAAAAETLRTTLALLRAEMAGALPGQEAAIDHLAGLLLVQAIRAHLAAGGGRTVGWLAGRARRPAAGDACIPRRCHRALDGGLARRGGGMSRSTFAERFRDRVGLAPLDYVARWRLHQVRGALIGGDRPCALIAAANGYRSRTSCS